MDEIHIGPELRALSNSIRRYFEFSTHHREIQSATGSNRLILHYLAENEERDTFQKDIESHFNIARSTASKVLGLMEQKGLITRQSVAWDARLKKIVLTQEARKIKSLMRENALQMERALTKGFTDEELKTLYSYLQRMRSNLTAPNKKNTEIRNV